MGGKANHSPILRCQNHAATLFQQREPGSEGTLRGNAECTVGLSCSLNNLTDSRWPPKIGRQKYFQLNRKYPLFDEVRKIVAKTIGVAHLIAQSLKRIEGIDEAYLYGSFASNQQDAASDIDVLVIGSPREKDLAQAVGKLERQLGREINYTVLTPKEVGSRRARKDAFLENVWHNKRVSLIGPNEEAEAARG